jgi:hypothetical protein
VGTGTTKTVDVSQIFIHLNPWLPNKSLNLRSPLRGVFIENDGRTGTIASQQQPYEYLTVHLVLQRGGAG